MKCNVFSLQFWILEFTETWFMLDKLYGAILSFRGLFLNIFSPYLLQLFRRMLPELFCGLKNFVNFL